MKRLRQLLNILLRMLALHIALIIFFMLRVISLFEAQYLKCGYMKRVELLLQYLLLKCVTVALIIINRFVWCSSQLMVVMILECSAVKKKNHISPLFFLHLESVERGLSCTHVEQTTFWICPKQDKFKPSSVAVSPSWRVWIWNGVILHYKVQMGIHFWTFGYLFVQKIFDIWAWLFNGNHLRSEELRTANELYNPCSLYKIRIYKVTSNPSR